MNTQLDFPRFFPCVLQPVATDDFQVYVYLNDGSVRLLDPKPLLQPGGLECPSSHPGGLLHGGDQQAPDGRSNHNAGGKTGQSALHPIPQTLFQEEYTGSAQGGTEKWGE